MDDSLDLSAFSFRRSSIVGWAPTQEIRCMIYQLISTSPHYRAHASPLLRIRLDALIFRALRASLVVMLGRASIRSHGFRCFPCNACILKSVAGTIVYSDSVRLVFSSKQTGSPFNSERSVFCHERTVNHMQTIIRCSPNPEETIRQETEVRYQENTCAFSPSHSSLISLSLPLMFFCPSYKTTISP